MSKGQNNHLLPHCFKKGQSGNPSGRPKDHSKVIHFARIHSMEALETVVAIMRNHKHPRLALKAAELLLDRAWGKVPNTITGAGGEGPVKLEVSWKNSEVATIDISPNPEVPLLESDDGE